jgi:PAS domain S-box-containing protein
MKKYLQTISLYFKGKIFATLGLQIISILALSLIALFLYLADKMVDAQNEAKLVTAKLTSQSVLDKIDRNFYERFGDVQAFAVNKLVIKKLSGDTTVANDLQSFMNTMTQYYVLYDLMLVVDLRGNVVMANTLDKKATPVNTSVLLNKNVANEEWFRTCISSSGPEGGAWYSDFFVNNDVSRLYNSSGMGMAFAAPIKDDNGNVIGVWYNFANWNDVTQGIRQAAEKDLHTTEPQAKIIITNNEGSIIDANDEKLIKDAQKLNTKLIENEDFSLDMNGEKIDFSNSEIGTSTAQGAYIYKGKNWNAFTVIPKSEITLSIFFTPDMLLAIFITLIFVIVFSFYSYRKIKYSVIDKTLYLKEILNQFSEGNIPQINKSQISDDEIGEIVLAVDKVGDNLNKMVTVLSEDITDSSQSSDIVVFNNKGILGESLIKMRDNLKQMIEEDKKRNWANTGLAQIGETLRQNLDNPEMLYDEIIKFIVKYMKVNQGAIFVTNDNNPKMMDLLSVYAYDKKKFIDKKIEKGDGLVGQVALEGATMYITEIPNNYAEIRSGLGGANPKAILLVPLKVNQEVVGVIELASFHELEDYQINYVEKIADSVASTISSVKVNARTKELLAISHQQAEEMRSAEEEMRQNLEEMSATQEEMQRKEIEMVKMLDTLKSTEENLVNVKLEIENQLKENKIQNEVFGITTILSEADIYGNILHVNKKLLEVSKYEESELIGKPHNIFRHPDMPKELFKLFWETIKSGKVFKGIIKNKAKDGSHYWVDGCFVPVKDKEGKIVKYIGARYHITDDEIAEKLYSEQLKKLNF